MVCRRQPLLVLLLVVLTFPATVAVQPDRDFTNAHQDWPQAGGDSRNSRYSTLQHITRANVSTLAGAWTKTLDGALRATPVVSDGLVFVPTRTQIQAFNAANGEPAWSYRPGITISSNAKGLATGEGLLFAGLVNTSMIALRQKTGALAWTYTFSRGAERAGPISSPST